MIKQVIKQKFNKDEIKSLPTIEFQGRIFVINNIFDTKKAVDYLMGQNILGIDTETKPSFKKGQKNKVALLQIATHDTAFLFQLKFTGFTDDIVKLLENKNITKVGLSLKDDLRALGERRQFTPVNFVDIQDEVRNLGIDDLSLQKIYANLFAKKISKRKQLSNWNAEILDEGQKKYAALDAVACIEIYEKLQELKNTHNYSLERYITTKTEKDK